MAAAVASAAGTTEAVGWRLLVVCNLYSAYCGYLVA